MGAHWLEIADRSGKRREPLNRGLTRVGGRDPEVEIAGSGGEQLHVYDEPPRMVHIGSGDSPRVNGAPSEDCHLATGDRIEWAGATIVYRGPVQEAALEEIEVPPDAVPSGSSLRDEEEKAWRRLQAGLLVELGMADKKVAGRWQQAVKQGQFEPDACAREILATQGAADEGRLVDRSGRLLRDLLMAPLLRGQAGARRRVREAGRNALAMFVTQLMALSVYTVLVVIGLLLLRIQGVEFDELFDRVLGPLAPK